MEVDLTQTFTQDLLWTSLNLKTMSIGTLDSELTSVGVTESMSMEFGYKDQMLITGGD